MTTPCRSDCPAGDCAGCAFPPMMRCTPSLPCDQEKRCARAALPVDVPAMDASIAAHRMRFAADRASGAPFCTLFLDVRGDALRAAA